MEKPMEEHKEKRVNTFLHFLQRRREEERKAAEEPRAFMGLPIRFLYSRFGEAGERLADIFDIGEEIKRANLFVTPWTYMAATVFYTLVAAIVAVPIAIILALFVSPIFAVLALVPPIVFFLLLYRPRLSSINRASGVDAELPLVASYVAMLAHAGLSPYRAVQRLVQTRLFPASQREARLIERENQLISHDPISAMESTSARHPCERYRNWIQGYVHVLRTGGDAVRYLEEQAGRFMEGMAEAWKKYAEDAAVFGDIMVTIYVLVPLCLFVMLIAFGASNVSLLAIYSFIVNPMLALLLVVLVDVMMPKKPEAMPAVYRKMVYGVPAAIAAGAVAYLLGLRPYYCLGLGLITLVAPPAVIYEREALRNRRVEKAVPHFLRDLTEQRRIGRSLEKAVVELQKHPRYGGGFNGVVDRLAMNLQIGAPLGKTVESISKRIRSWYANVMLFLFREAVETGGGSVETLESLSRFSTDYVESMQKARAGMRIQIAIGYAAALLMTYTITQIIFSCLVPQAQLAARLGPEALSMINLPTPETVQLIMNISFFAITMNSFLIGLLAGKMSEGTLAAGLKHAAICTAIALATFAFFTATVSVTI
jgi:flagellar protein FlaJ